MIVPKATVRVVDRLDPALAPAVVANVPIGLAIFASVTSEVGDGLTRLTEQAFTLPDDLTYQRHGMIFGSRLADAVTRMEITDAVFARNLRGYARQCIFHALLLGHISADDLRETTDLWALVTAGGSPSAGASPARLVEFATRQPAGATGAHTRGYREIVTCAEAAARLDALWAAEIGRAAGIFGIRIFPDADTEALARAELLAALPAAHDFLIGASRNAADIIRQQMVLNAVHDAGEQWSTETGNAAALSAYTEARAEAQTVAAYRAIGRQAETWVPLLRIVFECLYVGSFPMAVLLMLTPAGGAFVRAYLGGFVWLQSWGPLYAILHRISLGEAAERMAAAALMPGGDAGISLVAQAGIRAVAADVAVMSGYLSMSVPFLAAALAYGVGRATSLASSVLHVGQEAASAAAREGSTGNLSLGSTQLDTHRFATLEGRQVRTSAHVDTGRYTGYSPEGAAFTVAADGTAIADAGVATSRLPAAGIRLSESLAASHENRAAQSRTLGENFSAEAGIGPHGGGDRRHRDGRAAFQGRQRRHGARAWRHRIRVPPGPGPVEPRGPVVGNRRDHEGPGGVADGRSEPRGRLGQGRADGGQWAGVVAGPDHRERGVQPHAGLRRAAPGARYVVAGIRRLAAVIPPPQAQANWRAWTRVWGRTSPACGGSRTGPRPASRHRRTGARRRLRYAPNPRPSTGNLASRSSAGCPNVPGGDGRPIGVGGAMRLATPQTPEEAETLREYAAEFVSERLPAPVGAGVASLPSRATYEDAREDLQDTQTAGAEQAYGNWAEGTRERAAQAAVPGDVDRSAAVSRGDTEAAMGGRTGERVERTRSTEAAVEDGREAVESERSQPMGQQVLEEVPLIGGWLAGRLYGTARNDAPDAPLAEQQDSGRPARRSGAGLVVIVIIEKPLALAHEVLVGGPDPRMWAYLPVRVAQSRSSSLRGTSHRT